MAHSDIFQIADNFWNIRGSFKVGFVIDIATQVSLVKLKNGKFVFLDSYTLTPEVRDEVNLLTDGGKKVAAILNLHPFHTVHVENMHAMFPNANLYGTSRHVARFPELPWQPQLTEESALHALFKQDFEFSVPQGVDFISANENIHFASVLVFHLSSKTIHVDDSYMYIRVKVPTGSIELPAALSFHPTLAAALQKRPGAAQEFRQWAQQLPERWSAAENLCAAHTAPLTKARNRGATVPIRMQRALKNVKWILLAHEKWYR